MGNLPDGGEIPSKTSAAASSASGTFSYAMRYSAQGGKRGRVGGIKHYAITRTPSLESLFISSKSCSQRSASVRGMITVWHAAILAFTHRLASLSLKRGTFSRSMNPTSAFKGENSPFPTHVIASLKSFCSTLALPQEQTLSPYFSAALCFLLSGSFSHAGLAPLLKALPIQTPPLARKKRLEQGGSRFPQHLGQCDLHKARDRALLQTPCRQFFWGKIQRERLHIQRIGDDQPLMLQLFLQNSTHNLIREGRRDVRSSLQSGNSNVRVITASTPPRIALRKGRRSSRLNSSLLFNTTGSE